MASSKFFSSALSGLEGDMRSLSLSASSGAAPLAVSPLLCLPIFFQPFTCDNVHRRVSWWPYTIFSQHHGAKSMCV